MVDPEQPEEGTEPAAMAQAGSGSEGEADPTRDAVVEARLAALVARYGAGWDEAQRARVRANLERGTVLAARLRRTPLTNTDEPEIVFVPYRADA